MVPLLVAAVLPPLRAQAQVGGGGGNRPTVADFRAWLARAVPNPFIRILELNDSLALDLSPEQKRKLQVLGDSLKMKSDTLVNALAETLGETGRNADPMQVGMRMTTRIQEGRGLAQAAIKDAEAVLTPDQWAKIPKSVKEPFQQRPEGQGEGRRGRRGPPGG